MNIALLTGRGGSVSIKDKNLIPILGRPLMAYPIIAAKHAEKIDDIYLSTDGDKLKSTGREYGIKIIDRPPELALPTSQHIDCLLHSLAYFKANSIEVDILVVLLCNVATHTIGIIDQCITLLEENPDADSCVTVTMKNECSPLIAKARNEDDKMEPLKYADDKSMYIKPYISEFYELPESRRNLPPAYFLTHSIWALRVDNCFNTSCNGQPPWNFMGRKIIGLPVDGGTDIHDQEEIAYSEAWLRRQGWTESAIPEPKRKNIK